VNKRFLSFILILAICISSISGCGLIDDIFDAVRPTGTPEANGNNGNDDNGYTHESGLSDEELFDQMIDTIFAEWVSADSITMNFFLANPELMGIKRPEPTYGEVMTPELFEREREESLKLTKELATIRYNRLRPDQQITYDIIERLLGLSEILEREDDFAYYTGYIRPLNGIQIQLPVLLAEFNFYTAEDIERYLSLIADTERYFNDIIEFERERAVRGFSLSETNADTVIEQLEGFLKNRENNLIIAVFDDKIDKYEGLSTQQRESYKERHRELVLNNVLVAYDTLLTAMRELRGYGSAPGGFASLPGGVEFGHASLRLRAGTDRSVREIEDLIDEWRRKTLADARSILLNNSELNQKNSNRTTGQIKNGTPEEYLSILRDTMMHTFPAINPVDYVIMEVHESLSDMAPAFYLLPAVDNYDDNVIYINPASITENITLFTALAHEGYPGHMYQMVHLRQQSPHPIRIMLSNMGYTEGWAMYVELLSYYYAGLDEQEARLLGQMRMYYLLLQSHIDIGVNLLGWDKNDIAALLEEDLGITDIKVAESYFNTVTGVQLNTIVYTLGYIELLMLQRELDDFYGEDYSVYDFHSFFLNFGPAPYPIIRNRINYD